MSKSCVFCVAWAVVLSSALCATGCGARLSAGDAKALAEAKVFLTAGCDVNARDEDDLQHGIDMPGLARLLVSKGASLTARAKTRNMTPLEWALWSKDSGEAKTEMSKEFARILTDPNAGKRGE